MGKSSSLDTFGVAYPELLPKMFLTDGLTWDDSKAPSPRPYPDWVYELGTPIYALKAVDGAYYESNVTAARETAPNSKFRWKMEYNTIPVRGYEISGVGGSSTNTTYYVGRTNALSRNMVYGNFGSNITISTEYLQENIIYDIVVDYKNKQVLLNNNIVSSIKFDADAPTFNGNATKVPIGTYKPSAEGVPSGNTYDNTIYLVQQWIDDELVVNEIPFKANDGTLGMLDIVSRELLTNAGSGEFTAVEREFPDWVYEIGEPIWGVKTTGTQYIDTGYLVNYRTDKATYIMIPHSDSGFTSWCGVAGTNVGIERDDTLFNGTSADMYARAGINSTLNIKSVLDNLLYITIDYASGMATINGVSDSQDPFTADESPYNLRIMARGSSAASAVGQSIQTWCRATLSDKFDFIPMVFNDGSIGMVNLLDQQKANIRGSDALLPIRETDIMQQLINMGVTPSSSVEENIVMLNNMGVSV